MPRYMIKRVRQSFMTYWTPEAFPDSLDPTKFYGGTYILQLDHPQLAQIKQDNLILCEEKWGKEPMKDSKGKVLVDKKGRPISKGKAMLKSITDKGKIFLRDGDTKPELDGFPGNMYISARSKVRPNYFGADKMPLTEEMGILYSGCYVNVSIETYAYTKGNNGLGARLRGVQFAGKGEAFGGGGPPSDDSEFDEIAIEDEEGDSSGDDSGDEDDDDPLG